MNKTGDETSINQNPGYHNLSTPSPSSHASSSGSGVDLEFDNNNNNQRILLYTVIAFLTIQALAWFFKSDSKKENTQDYYYKIIK